MKKGIISAGILIFLAVIIGYFFFYNKPHKDISSLDPAFKVEAGSLFNEYSENEEKANEKYLNKVVEVSGTVLSQNEIKVGEEDRVVIILESSDEMFGVSCSFVGSEMGDAKKLKKGDQVKIKGVLNGWNMDVVLEKCSIVK